VKPVLLLFILALGSAAQAPPPAYDLLLKNGHVIDPNNMIDRVVDVAIAGGKIAKVAANIPASDAARTADLTGLYVTPGLVDIHVHVYAGTGKRAIAGDQSVYPDGFTFRSGVTTVVDAGTSGWRTFPDFREKVIDRAKTRVLAFINIVGAGMAGGRAESDPTDMDGEATGKMALANPDVVVGFKSAHFAGEGWPAIDGAVKAGNLAKMPVMIDFGSINAERNLSVLLRDKLRPGDIYTHCYSGLRQELVDGKVNAAMTDGRKRGIMFDVGHGGGSFFWNIAVPMFEQGFLPDSISTDLHTGSMNGGMKDMAETMSKILNLGVPLDRVIEMSTWNPAKEIRRPQLGNLDVGSEADVAVLRLETGEFGFPDSAGARRMGTQRLSAELTVRKGVVVWDLNGRASQDWKTFDYKKRRRPQ
jgi:dihydroorotase